MQNRRRINSKNCIVNTIIPLIIGGGLYYLFCPQVLFVKQLDLLFGVGFHVSQIRNSFFMVFRNYFFDFVWAYSFSSAVSAISENKVIRLSIPIIFVSVLEVMQMFIPKWGTFDLIDIIIEVIASLIVWLFFNTRGK